MQPKRARGLRPLSSERFKEIPEKAFQRQVTELAQLLGWQWVHVSHSPQVNAGVVTRYTTPTHGTLGKGWPDLVLIREKDKRLIFAELKSEAGKVSAEQQQVLNVLRSLTGISAVDAPWIEVYVWRPSHIDTIAEILA